MKIEALEKVYPIKRGPSPHTTSVFSFENDGEQYYIEKSELTTRELELFTEVLFSNKESAFDTLPSGSYRIIQFKTADFDLIAEQLSLIFPNIVKIKKQSSDYGIAIEQLAMDRLYDSEMKQTLMTFCQDLGVVCTYYIGLFSDQAELHDIYQTEKRNFDQGLSFSEALIKEGLHQVTNRQLSKIKQSLLLDLEAQELIQHLYQNDGNQLQTAKTMFIHRNTLTQKMKKFEAKYGLSLTGSDLVLLYSLMSYAQR